ncbi:hypothetical protein B0H19DRAFT_1269465 [Mycena capillaripes]|nr:hypothetical protein B0H19DRAFT_1269465 [Mycena capillaripes]
MFALRRAPLRLAARVPFLRPPRISAGYSVQPSDPAFRETPDISGMLSNLEKENPDASSAASAAPSPAPPSGAAPPLTLCVQIQIQIHLFHCHSTRTNTINTFTDPDGNVLSWFSGGSCGFRKRNRSTYEAGYQCAIRMFEKIEARAVEQDAKEADKPLTVDLFCKGFGFGREALFKALMTAQGDGVRTRIVSITDRTAIKIGGTRSKKRKRR